MNIGGLIGRIYSKPQNIRLPTKARLVFTATDKNAVSVGGDFVTGLIFPSNGDSSVSDVRFTFTGAALLPRQPATYIWRIKTVQQTGYYTTMFWGQGNGSFSGTGYYGAHPYPQGGSGGTTHNWEISIEGTDGIIDDNANSTILVHDVWRTQAVIVTDVGSNQIQVKFYWDLSDTSKVITYTTTSYSATMPPSPELTFGDNAWATNTERMSATFRGLQIYATNLSLADVQTEAANDSVNTPQTSAGLGSVWYMNQNPTPDDISDKSGQGHNPAWHSADKAKLYTDGLAIHSSNRYLTYNNSPFLVVGDTPWSLPVNCSNAQIDSYIADRYSKGCTAILIEGCEKAYSSQTPAYLNVDGQAPFTNMSPVNWVINSGYWNRVDYIVNECKTRNMLVFITPAYTGYGSGNDGWLADYSSVSDSVLQAYGAALANRYTQGNVVWVLGGDDANDIEAAGNYGSGTTPNRTKQWQIVLGILSVRSTDLITGHTARNTTGTVSGEAYKAWTTGYTGFNLNNVYAKEDTTDAPGLASIAQGRAGYPFFLIEAGYENTDGSDVGGIVPAMQSVLSGGIVGWFGGHDALWHMGSTTPNTGAASVLSTYLSGSWVAHSNFGTLLKSKSWWLLEPKTDTSLVTTSLGTGSSTICPSLASDGTFALIFVPNISQSLTVNMASFSVPSVRARWWSYGDGSFTAINTYANSGTQSFTSWGSK